MAETGKKTVVGATPPTNDPSPDIARREDERPDTPEESSNAPFLVKSRWPNGSFTVEGIPVINREGTRLTKAQLDKATEMAELCGVTLEVEEVK